MPHFVEQALLRIFVGEDDRAGNKSLYEAVVLEARDTGLAGTTVLRGPMGFGRQSRVHTAKILRLSENLPVVIEIIDREDRLLTFIDAIQPMIGTALVTLERVRVARGHDTADSAN